MEDDGALIGVDVGGYVIERELGRGGMGVVYAATHPMIGKRVAIKVIQSSLASSPETVERFVQEARAVNQIGHPNIVDIFAFGTLEDGRSYLVMKMLDGESLRRRIRRGAIPGAEAAQIIGEIAEGLAAAHAKGFVHRDLKPDNVFLCTSATGIEIKVLDFGLAKLVAGTDGRAFRTATGAVLGTPDYMSPEQLRGRDVDHRADIHALGIMAFEMLTQRRPSRLGDGTFDIDGMSFKPALLAISGIPAELAELIESMVAVDPGERPSLAAVHAVLKRVTPLLASTPALSNVRPVASEMSIGAFNPSHLGAVPVVPAPSAAPSPASSPALSPAPVQHAGLRAPGSAGHAGTKLGAAPAPAPPSKPHPITAARPARESKAWLFVGALLVVAASAALVVVLLG